MSHPPSLRLSLHGPFTHLTTIHISVNPLTSDKHHGSVHFSLRRVATHDVGSRSVGQRLVHSRNGVTPTAQWGRVHDRAAVLDGMQLLPFLHNAAEGGVAPHGDDSVLGEHVDRIARDITF